MTEGWQDRCDRVFFGGGYGGCSDISKIAEICCDIVRATLCIRVSPSTVGRAIGKTDGT